MRRSFRRQLHAAARAHNIPEILRALQSKGYLATSVAGPSAPSKFDASSLAEAVERQAATKAAVVYDLDALRGTFSACKRAFPNHFCHALAIKSAPMAFMIDEAVAMGLGGGKRHPWRGGERRRALRPASYCLRFASKDAIRVTMGARSRNHNKCQ